MKIRPVGAELFRADGLTDMMKVIVAFRNYRTRLQYVDFVYIFLYIIIYCRYKSAGHTNVNFVELIIV